MTSRSGRCRHDTEAAQQCLEAAAGLLRLGIGLHCCNTRHRAKMGSPARPARPPFSCLCPPVAVDGEDEEQTTCRSTHCLQHRVGQLQGELTHIGMRYHGRQEVPRVHMKYPGIYQSGPPRTGRWRW